MKKIKAFLLKYSGKSFLTEPDYCGGEEIMVVYSQCSRCQNYTKKINNLPQRPEMGLCDFCFKSFNNWIEGK